MTDNYDQQAAANPESRQEPDAEFRRRRWRKRFSFWHMLKHWLSLLVIVLLVSLVYQLREVLICVIIALTLAAAIAPIAEGLEQKAKVPRVLTVLVIYFLTATVYSVLVAALYPTIREQAINLYNNFPNYVGGVIDLYGKIRELLGENASALTFSTLDARTFVAKVSAQALTFTQNALGMVVSTILVLFLTAYFVIEAKDIWAKLLDWVPRSNRDRFGSLIRPLESRLGGYVRGQLLVSLAVATVLTTGMSLIGVDHALLLGSLSGLLNLVPFVGSMMTCVLALLVSFNESTTVGFMCLGLFAVEQWLESNFIVPTLLGKQVELHPLVVLFSILTGATLLGLPGALIAVPVATMCMFLAEEFYFKPMKAREAGGTTNGAAGSSEPTAGTTEEVGSADTDTSQTKDAEPET